MNVWGKLLDLFGWSVEITAPRRDKCVICVAPHTSNQDFFLGLSAYKSLGRKANFLIKDFWFFFPFNIIMRSLGGIPVSRKKKSGISLTDSVIRKFGEEDYMNIAVAPEGTRDARQQWHTGFIYIAHGANVPIQLGILDYKHKRIIIRDEYHPTGDIEADMAFIKKYYADLGDIAKYPELFKY